MATETRLRTILGEREAELLSAWRQEQAASLRPEYLQDDEFIEQSRVLLHGLVQAMAETDAEDLDQPVWAPVRQVLDRISRSWAYQGFTPAETATFILSLKRALFDQLRRVDGVRPEDLMDDAWLVSHVLDRLALYTTEVYQTSRESVIARQQQELLELSTPVVQLWRGVVVLPLIGTLDSARTQLVMESLLQTIVDTSSTIAIIDITGVAAVDTLVAQHLLKTVAAARLMGANCIISGISPQIAQTIVHLGVDLSEVDTKSTLADAFALALERRGLSIVPSPRD